jgi:hypothetical protein
MGFSPLADPPPGIHRAALKISPLLIPDDLAAFRGPERISSCKIRKPDFFEYSPLRGRAVRGYVIQDIFAGDEQKALLSGFPANKGRSLKEVGPLPEQQENGPETPTNLEMIRK